MIGDGLTTRKMLRHTNARCPECSTPCKFGDSKDGRCAQRGCAGRFLVLDYGGQDWVAPGAQPTAASEAFDLSVAQYARACYDVMQEEVNVFRADIETLTRPVPMSGESVAKAAAAAAPDSTGGGPQPMDVEPGPRSVDIGESEGSGAKGTASGGRVRYGPFAESLAAIGGWQTVMQATII